MNIKLLEATDITSGSFLLLLLVTLVSTIIVLVGSAWVSRKWKLPVTLASMVTLVSAAYYFEASQVWQSSHDISSIYRYITWIVTMPLQVMVMYFFVNTMASLSTWLFWRLLVASVTMVLVRYLGEINLMYPTLGFLISLVCWLYILGEVFFGHMSEISFKSSNFSVHRGYFWMRLIISIGWAIYPLCYFIIGFAGGVSTGKLNIIYNLADLVNQVAFSLTVLSASIRDSGNNR